MKDEKKKRNVKKVKSVPDKDIEDLYIPKLEKETEIKENDIFVNVKKKPLPKHNRNTDRFNKNNLKKMGERYSK